MSDIAGQLEQKIEDVQQERQRVTIEMRRAAARSRNEKARRLVSRLEDCDESIANLLSQAADCLEALVSTNSRSDNHSEGGAEAREVFEARAQDWFGSLHDVQMGLRSAVKNLRKAQVTPVAYDASTSTKGASSSSSFTTSGSASRGHSLALYSSQTQNGHQNELTPSNSNLLQVFVDVGQGQYEMQSSISDFSQESKLSLSALRLQESSWKSLANSLQELAISKQIMFPYDSEMSDSSSNSSGILNRSTKGANIDETQLLLQGAQDLLSARASQDARLLRALVRDDGFAV